MALYDNGTPPAPKKMGRPTRLTPELHEKICDMVSAGVMLGVVCQQLSIHPAVMWRWQESNADFNRDLSRARMHGSEMLVTKAQQILAEVVDAKAGDSARVTAAQNLAYHLRWCASKLKPHVYGDAVRVESKSEVLLKDERDAIRDKLIDAALGHPTVADGEPTAGSSTAVH